MESDTTTLYADGGAATEEAVLDSTSGWVAGEFNFLDLLEIRTRFRGALDGPVPFEALRDATKLVLAKHGRELTYGALEALRQTLAAEANEELEDVTINVLDCLVGWCGASHRM